MACCHDSACPAAAPSEVLNSPRWRRALWIALIVNAGFFMAEMIAGAAARSTALQADALDFFGDAASYAISLGVAGLALMRPVRGWLEPTRRGLIPSCFGA
jgi:Co/Zn/Cd efflux system component